MGMPTTSIAQNPTNSAPMSQSGGKGGGKGISSMATPPVSQTAPQQTNQSYQTTTPNAIAMPPSGSNKGGMDNNPAPNNMTLSATSGQPQTGQPNPYPNTTGSWDNSSTQQPQAQMSGGKGKGA